MQDKDLIVTVKDVRNDELDYCIDVMSKWFNQHRDAGTAGFEGGFKSFVRHGIRADYLMATGDAMAIKAVEYAKRQVK